MAKSPEGDRWIPVRTGKYYCSPACGGHCTHAAYLAATKAATELAKQLGPGWTPKVHENLGWWWCVEKGTCELRRDRDGKYWTSMFQFNIPNARRWKSPHDALKDQIRHCKAQIDAMCDQLAELTL